MTEKRDPGKAVTATRSLVYRSPGRWGAVGGRMCFLAMTVQPHVPTLLVKHDSLL
jgi:hypothetical protein